MTDQTDPNDPTILGPVDPTEGELTARLDRTARRVRGQAVTRSSVAARLRTRSRHRRQLRIGMGALFAGLVLVAGFAAAKGRDDRTNVRVAGQPGPSSPTPTGCTPSAELVQRPILTVPDQVKVPWAFELLQARVLTADQTDEVLAGHKLMITVGQAALLESRDFDGQRSFLLETANRDGGAPPPRPREPATTVPVPPLKPGQTPFDAWVDALRQGHLLTPDQEAQVRAGRGIGITPEQSNFLTERGYFRTPAAPSDPSSDERPLSPEERRLIEAYVRDLRSAPGPGPATTEPCAPSPGSRPVESSTSTQSVSTTDGTTAPTTTAASTTTVPATFAPPPTTTAPATFAPASNTTTTSAANGN